ncbi:putative RNA-binding protein CP33, chloroplastic [Blattamonas nauphoetae]|uniref:RNA-binding protein CP33, chloroplastic n=1 Tax=Blattamonas nauphoetae TaxID=2049346 RepID=A0ABQ9XXL3_9EUKA|nr:putative RNA-binding protein CP33, chloroplastic [Blattamonas nauphoetae]
MTRLYCGNLPFTVTAEDLSERFSAVGQVTNVSIASRFRKSLGFGFVEMANEDDALNAMKQLNNTEIEGRVINVELSRSTDDQRGTSSTQPTHRHRPTHQKGNKSRYPRRGVIDPNTPLSETGIHVKNLPWTITEEELRNAFPGCKVAEIVIAKTHTNRVIGYGFVYFENSEEMQKGLEIGQNLTIKDRLITCSRAFLRDAD